MVEATFRMKEKKVIFGRGRDDDGGGRQSTDRRPDVDAYTRGDLNTLNLDILPSLGATARSNRKVQLYRWIVSPFDPRYKIQALLQNRPEIKKSSVLTGPKQQGLLYSSRSLSKYSSEPTITSFTSDVVPPVPELSGTDNRRRRRADNYKNSLSGVIAAANAVPMTATENFQTAPESGVPARVTLNRPGKSEINSKLVLSPTSLEELLDIGAKKFGFSPIKIFAMEGVEIDNINIVRDGDHLILTTDAGYQVSASQRTEGSSRSS